MLAIVGTVPDQNFPLTTGKIEVNENTLKIDNISVNINRGTPALLAAVVTTLNAVNSHPEFKNTKSLDTIDIIGFLAGDIGLGDGSIKLYKYLVDNISKMDIDVIVFHYLQPDVDWHNKILFKLKDLQKKPIIIADAGFMYAAKMSGLAPSYDLFTPDVGELAFLADEKAPHPFYTRGFILHEDNKIPDLIKRSYSHENAAKNLLVKGATDYIANQQGIIDSVDSPSADTMEAIGGTGDTLTGIVTALIRYGIEIPKAGKIAAKVNRIAGFLAKPNPATQVNEIIKNIPMAIEKVLHEIKEPA